MRLADVLDGRDALLEWLNDAVPIGRPAHAEPGSAVRLASPAELPAGWRPGQPLPWSNRGPSR